MPALFSVIIPAFNEARTIERAIRETQGVFQGVGATEIIVIDDGSTDETAALVERFGSSVQFIRHAVNLGKGAAVKTGIQAAVGEWALFLDADLATHPMQVALFLPHLETADVVIGSRRVPGSRILERQPWYREWAGRAFNAFIRIYFGIAFHDTQCGFKAFHRRTFSVFDGLQTYGWVFDVELLLDAQAAGFRVHEVPVTWRHGRESRVRLSNGWGILRALRQIKRERVRRGR